MVFKSEIILHYYIFIVVLKCTMSIYTNENKGKFNMKNNQQKQCTIVYCKRITFGCIFFFAFVAESSFHQIKHIAK